MDENNMRKRPEIGETGPIFFVYSNATTKTEIPKRTLTHIRVDSSVREIPPKAFEDCKALMHVQLPETLAMAGKYAFRCCANLKCVQFISNPSVEASSFGHSLKDGLIVFPEDIVLQIDASAFAFCHSLRKVIFSSVSTKLGDGAFQYCRGLVSVELPGGLRVIEDSLFSDCESLTTVKIPSCVIKIRDHAFNNCRSLAFFDLPHGLLEIGKFSFQFCRSIETLHIPSTVSTIGQSAFYQCSGLKRIIFPPTLENIECDLLNGCHRLEYIEIPPTVKKISRKAFSNCKALSNLRIPSSAGYIGRSAFSNCEGLISLELPDRSLLTDDTEDSWLSGSSYRGIYECKKLVNVLANPGLIGEGASMEAFLQDSKIGRVVGGYDDFLWKSKHRFDKSPLNKLCYYQSYYSSEDSMLQLRSLMEDDPLAAATQVDEFGMTPLHILSLAQTPNLSMLLTVMNGGPPDYMVRGRDSFGSTPMDYLCLNKMPSSTQVIRSLLQATFVNRVDRMGLERWRSDLLQAVDEALTMDRSLRSRVIGLAHFQLANCEQKEVSSLVELCLWKMKIDEVGQSTDRQICRINCGASIVIPHVLQSLGKLDIEDYFISAQSFSSGSGHHD